MRDLVLVNVVNWSMVIDWVWLCAISYWRNAKGVAETNGWLVIGYANTKCETWCVSLRF